MIEANTLRGYTQKLMEHWTLINPQRLFERNVRAFSDPYEGGWIEFNKKKSFLKKVKVIKDKDQRFDNKIFNGRIIRKQKNGEVIIIVGGGLVAVKSVFVNGLEKKAFKFFKLNSCIRNSQKNLRPS